MVKKPISEAAVDKAIAHSIRDLVTRLNRRFRKQISNADQLSVAELNVIRLLLDNQLLPSELCAQLGLSSQYVSQVLQKLEGLAYISRKSADGDKRKSYALITDKGRKWLVNSREEREEWLARAIAERFSTEEKALIRKVVELLAILPEL